MVNVFPKQVKKEIIDDWINNETWKVALLDSGFTYDHTTDILYTDVSGDEVAASGTYVAGGSTLAGRAGAYSGTDYYLDATDTAWTGATFVNVQYVVVYETAANKIRFIFDLGGTYSCTNSTFTIVWNASGLVILTS